MKTLLLIAALLFSVSLFSQGWIRSYPVHFSAAKVYPFESPNGNLLIHATNDVVPSFNQPRKESLLKLDALGGLITRDDSITQQYGARAIRFTHLNDEDFLLTGIWWSNTYFQAKIDNLLKHTYIGLFTTSLLTDIIVYPNQELVVGNGTFTKINNQTASIQTITKLDAAKNPIWTVRDTSPYTPAVGNYSNNQIHFFEQASENNSVIAVFGRYLHELNTVRLHDIVMIKVDAQGNLMWKKIITLPNNVTLGYYTFSIQAHPNFSYFYVRLNKDFTMYDGLGNPVWTKGLGNIQFNIFDDGNIASFTGYDLVKYDKDFNQLWKKSLNGLGAQFSGVSATEISNNDLICVAKGIVNQQNYLYVIRTDKNGNFTTPTLTGNAFIDSNNNLKRDSTEKPFAQLILQSAGKPGFFQNTDKNGNYTFFLPSNTKEIYVKSLNPFRKPCIDTIFPDLKTKLTDTIDIPVCKVAECTAVDVHIQHSRFRRCFDGFADVEWNNFGTVDVNPVIEVKLDANLIVDSITLAPVSQMDNTFYFMPGTLVPGESGSVRLFYKVNCDVPLGERICSEVSTALDTTCLQYGSAYNWHDKNCGNATGSYDPNDKSAVPEGYGARHYIQRTDALQYLIRFQNTGTDTAFTVVVADTLSDHLDPSTFRLDIASHPVEWNLSGRGILKFTFPNIMLPDSNVNERLSHGFVRYHILPRTDAPILSKINNRAGIYFDFNEPVITNTVSHTIDRFWYYNHRDTAVCSGTKFLGLSVSKDTVVVDTVTYTENYLVLDYAVKAKPSYYAEFDTVAHIGDTIFNYIVKNAAYTLTRKFKNVYNCDSVEVWRITGLTAATDPAQAVAFSVYPNPATQHVQILSDLFAERSCTLFLYNETGSLVLQKQYPILAGKIATLKLDEMPNGIYWLRLVDEQGRSGVRPIEVH